MAASLSTLTEALLAAAARAGADAADAVAVAGTSLTVDIRKGALEQAERAEGTEVGLRVFIGGGRPACRPRTPRRGRWRCWPNARWRWRARRRRTRMPGWPIRRSLRWTAMRRGWT